MKVNTDGKIGPMVQNPVLCRIFMVGLLSQVMDNAIGNVVNAIVVNDAVITVRAKPGGRREHWKQEPQGHGSDHEQREQS